MKAYYLCGTHWDREWYEPFQEFRLWLVQNLDQIIDRLQAEPRFRVFHLDGQSVLLEDYLEIRPERRSELAALLAAGRLVAGPWYAPPDQWLVSGEALIRNLALGRRLVRDLGARPMAVGYMPDLFGHLASMPTLFAGFDLPYAVVWRGLNDEQVPSQFHWLGPDGSRVLTHRLPDNAGYPWFASRLRWAWTQSEFDPQVIREQAPQVLAEERTRSAVPVLYLSDAGDHQTMPERVPEMLDLLGQACPDITFVHGTIEEYFAAVAACLAAPDGPGGQAAFKLPEFQGELRHVARRTGMPWHALIPHCLSSRYPLKQRNDHCQSLLTLWAEPLAAYAALAGAALPPGYLETAWKWLLKNHPHDSICGCSVDETHADMDFRFHQAEGIGDGLRRQAMARLSSPVGSLAKATGVTVWNPLPWPRREIAELEIAFPADFPAKAMRSGHNFPVVNQFEVVDDQGGVLPHQILAVARGQTVKVANEQGRRLVGATNADLYRLALPVDLPAGGFATLAIRPLAGVGTIKRLLGTLRRHHLEAENQHFRLAVLPTGLVELGHPASGKTYRDLFQYEDSGDAGDGWNFVPPLANPLVVSPGQAAQPAIVDDGPLQVTFRIDRLLRVPVGLDPRQPESRSQETIDLPITDYLTMRADDPALHVRTVVDNRARDHRLRVLLPADLQAGHYWSDQPFAWVRRPIATDPGSSDYKEPDPVERPHHTVFALGDANGGLAVLCPAGLHEHSVHDDCRRTLALTLFRGVDKTPTTTGEPGPQVLGKLEFNYSLLPFTGDLPRAAIGRRVMAMQAGLHCHLSDQPPQRQSHFELVGDGDLIATAIKPGSDGQSVVVRLWNPGEQAAEACLRLPGPPRQVSLCNLEETPIAPLAGNAQDIRLTIQPGALATVRLDCSPTS